MFRNIISMFVIFAFGLTSLNPAQAQMIATPQIILPAVGAVVNVSKAFSPTLIKGLTVDQNDPFKFQFIMDTGDSGLEGEAFKNESYKMIKYFMASLATPENNMWVNLSPYEKDRIIPDVFGKTEMGRDLLAQDYILKQLTATLMSPENEEGKKFWEKIYTKIYESQSGKVSEFQNNKLSSMNSTHLSSSNVTHLSSSNVLVPSYRGLPKVVEDPASSVVKSKSNDSFDVMQQAINTFNKVWIVPQTGYFYEHNNSVFITDARLKVMLEEDYVAAQKSSGTEGFGLDSRPDNTMTPEAKQLIRDVIIPVIEQEVNEGENFANLRQIYNAMLLSVWFKKRLKDHVLGQVYADKEEISGIRLQPSADGKYEVEKIWEQYVDAFKTGVSNVIKDEYDPATQSIVPRKYFSGGAEGLKANNAQLANQEQAKQAATFKGAGKEVNFAMMTIKERIELDRKNFEAEAADRQAALNAWDNDFVEKNRNENRRRGTPSVLKGMFADGTDLGAEITKKFYKDNPQLKNENSDKAQLTTLQKYLLILTFAVLTSLVSLKAQVSMKEIEELNVNQYEEKLRARARSERWYDASNTVAREVVAVEFLQEYFIPVFKDLQKTYPVLKKVQMVNQAAGFAGTEQQYQDMVVADEPLYNQFLKEGVVLGSNVKAILLPNGFKDFATYVKHRGYLVFHLVGPSKKKGSRLDYFLYRPTEENPRDVLIRNIERDIESYAKQIDDRAQLTPRQVLAAVVFMFFMTGSLESQNTIEQLDYTKDNAPSTFVPIDSTLSLHIKGFRNAIIDLAHEYPLLKLTVMTPYYQRKRSDGMEYLFSISGSIGVKRFIEQGVVVTTIPNSDYKTFLKNQLALKYGSQVDNIFEQYPTSEALLEALQDEEGGPNYRKAQPIKVKLYFEELKGIMEEIYKESPDLKKFFLFPLLRREYSTNWVSEEDWEAQDKGKLLFTMTELGRRLWSQVIRLDPKSEKEELKKELLEIIRNMSNRAMLANQKVQSVEADKGSLDEKNNTGGVNLNASQADIQIHQSENGFKFPKMDPAMLKGDLKMIPVILNISPITTGEVRLLLGLNDKNDSTGEPTNSTDVSQPRDKMRELEKTT